MITFTGLQFETFGHSFGFPTQISLGIFPILLLSLIWFLLLILLI